MNIDFQSFETLAKGESKDTCFPIFKMEAVEDKAESLKAGHKIFVNKEVVEIHVPGDKTTIPKHFVDEKHRQRWPVQYAAFKRGQTVSHTGTPVDHWPLLGPAEVKMMKACDIATVEILANYPEHNLPKIPDFMRWKKKAQDWLASATANADVVKLGEDLRTAIERISHLEARNAELMAALEAAAPPEKQKRKYVRRTATDLPGKHD